MRNERSRFRFAFLLFMVMMFSLAVSAQDEAYVSSEPITKIDLSVSSLQAFRR